jgi:hypothetical protein
MYRGQNRFRLLDQWLTVMAMASDVKDTPTDDANRSSLLLTESASRLIGMPDANDAIEKTRINWLVKLGRKYGPRVRAIRLKPAV